MKQVDMEIVMASHPHAEITSIRLGCGKSYAVIEDDVLHMISMGWWSTEEKAWASARASIEAKKLEGR